LQLLELGALHPGSISEQCNVCGNPGCRCKDPKKPQKHGPYYQLRYTWQGKSSTRFLRPEKVEEMRQKVVNYKQLRELMKGWVGLAIDWERAEEEHHRGDGPPPPTGGHPVLQQMLVSLPARRESQERRLRQVQHLLGQLLRARYGPSGKLNPARTEEGSNERNEEISRGTLPDGMWKFPTTRPGGSESVEKFTVPLQPPA